MTRRQRGWILMATLCSGVTLYQGIGFTTGYLPLYGGLIGGERGNGCARYATNGLSSSIDFCFLLDCQNGFFGGLVDPCANAGSATDALLMDCTNIGAGGANGTDQGATTGTTGTTNTGTNTNQGT